MSTAAAEPPMLPSSAAKATPQWARSPMMRMMTICVIIIGTIHGHGTPDT